MSEITKKALATSLKKLLSKKELSKITDTIYGENYTNGNIESEKKRLLKVVDKINY